MLTSYGELCTEVYDLSKPLGYSTGDVKYYIDRLSGMEGKVLEAGCGSGRILIPLLQAGIDIDGLDNSMAMLDSCKKRCAERNLDPLLVYGEMHDFSVDHLYETIIIPGGSFQLIEEREQAITALHHLMKYLLPGGRIIMDLFIPTDYTLNTVSTRSWEAPSGEVLLLEDKKIEVNLLEQKIVSFLKYEKWKEGRLVQTELQRFPLRWYGYYEFKMLLEQTGYQDISMSADYQFGEQAVRAGQMVTYEATKSSLFP